MRTLREIFLEGWPPVLVKCFFAYHLLHALLMISMQSIPLIEVWFFASMVHIYVGMWLFGPVSSSAIVLFLCALVSAWCGFFFLGSRGRAIWCLPAVVCGELVLTLSYPIVEGSLSGQHSQQQWAWWGFVLFELLFAWSLLVISRRLETA